MAYFSIAAGGLCRVTIRSGRSWRHHLVRALLEYPEKAAWPDQNFRWADLLRREAIVKGGKVDFVQSVDD